MGKKRILLTGLSATLLVAGVLYMAGVFPVLAPRFHPSGSAAYVPDPEENFAGYLAENRRRIETVLTEYYYRDQAQPFGPAYSLAQVVEMRSPFEIAPDDLRCSGEADEPARGFLLIHGLTDSPYLLRPLAESLASRYPCARIRSLLTPGHGTVPGDLLTAHFEAWRQVVDYGVDSFTGEVDDLYLVGYSNGAALALDHVHRAAGESVSGLILLSPGLASAQPGLSFSGLLKFFVRWVSKGADQDPVKYDSMPMHAAAQFYQATQSAVGSRLPPVAVPLLMAVSGEDTTIDTAFVADWFCNRVSTSKRRMIWYRSVVTERGATSLCAGVQNVDSAVPAMRYLSHSHVALSMPPGNPHYGVDGRYAVCNAYVEEPAQFHACRTDNAGTVYGEATLMDETGFYQGRLVRRASFNPFYEDLLVEIDCLVRDDCEW